MFTLIYLIVRELLIAALFSLQGTKGKLNIFIYVHTEYTARIRHAHLLPFLPLSVSAFLLTVS